MIKKLSLHVTSLALLTATFPFPVLAQQGQSAALEEVVVSARRRDEMLQDTPIPVSAYNSDRIEELGIHSTMDLQQNAPSVAITSSTSKSPSIYIRGMGQRTDTSLFDPSVGMYLNNILIPRQDSGLLDTIDVENVQVLRGPQGTLFGKNNVGGAILVTAKKPDLQQASGEVSTRIGDYGRRDFRFSGNLPLVEDKLGLRASVNKTSLDGFFKNELDGKGFGDENRRSAALSLLWNASDAFSAELFGYFSQTRERGLASTCIFQNPASSLPNLSFPGQPRFIDACRASEEAGRKGQVDINTDQSHFKLDNNIVALTANWNINDDWSLSNIVSMSWSPLVEHSDDSDGTAGRYVAIGSDRAQEYYGANGFGAPREHRKQLTEELKISGSAFNENLHFTGGMFGSSERIKESSVVSVIGAGGIAGVDQSLLPIPIPAGSIVPLAFWSGTTSDLKNDSYALFGELSFNPIDWVELTLGGRYTSELRHRDLNTSQIDLPTLAARLNTTPNYLGQSQLLAPISIADFNALQEVPLPLTNLTTQSASQRFNKFTPALTGSVFASGNWMEALRMDSLMGYLTYSKGFKAGGFDVKGTDIISVNPENVTNYELGVKTDVLEHRMRVNLSVFHTKWDDMQLLVAEQGPGGPTDIQSYYANAGKATINGVELESFLALGGWTFGLSGSYLDSRYNKFTTTIPNVGVVDRSGEPLYSVPQYTYTVSMEYNYESPIGPIVPRLSYYFRDKAFMGFDYKSAGYDSSWSDNVKLLNFRVSYKPTEHLRTALYVDNVTDENYIVGGYAATDATGFANVMLGAPRNYGVELNYSF